MLVLLLNSFNLFVNSLDKAFFVADVLDPLPLHLADDIVQEGFSILMGTELPCPIYPLRDHHSPHETHVTIAEFRTGHHLIVISIQAAISIANFGDG